jgi:hypothetical protein
MGSEPEQRHPQPLDSGGFKSRALAAGQFGGFHMKRLVFGLVVLFAIVVVTKSFAADQRNVYVINGTGYGIKFLGFNTPDDDEWDENELGDNAVLPNGNGVYVKFNEADDGCVWKFRISWADPGYPDVLWRDVNLCEISEITLKYNRNTDTTSFVGK